ncbi:hypothetical protein F4680DRAFT_410812 [Xylaria scruposa]|nr:hypothetical protein F4680DRAFT_410812 [Xylaria scruposa]
MQRFAKEEPELYKMMKNTIENFGHQPIDNWDTWLNNRQKASERNWFRRCKAYMPSLRALKVAAMALSDLDPHKLAPAVTAALFLAIELCFESVEPSARDKAMSAMMKANGVINKWTDSEIDLRGLKGRCFKSDTDLAKIEQIEANLEVLYLGCLKLISSIYKSGKTRRGRAASSLISEPAEWDQAYQKLNDKNSECSEWKTQVESAVKRKHDILDRIRIRSEDPEPGHQMIKERTGIDKIESVAGEWFMDTFEYTSWLDEIRHGRTEKRLFWLKGSMGTGKTTRICRIITHLEKQPVHGVRFVPYYCYASGTNKESKAPKHETIVRALCYRLAWNDNGSIAKPTRDLFEAARDIDASFTVKSTWEPLLKDLIAYSKKKVVFVIDALDECESPKQYNLFLEFLRRLPNTPQGPYCLISARPHVQVRDYFNSLIQLDAANEMAKQDMKIFIKDQIDSQNNGTGAKSIFFKNDSYRCKLEKALYDNAGGMFRWIEIWLGVFFPKNKKPIQQEKYARELLDELGKLKTLDRLEKLQRDEDTDFADFWKNHLHKAYRQLWDINGDEQYKALQISAFKIIMGAFESLTPRQLLEAISLDLTNFEDGAALELDELEGLYYNFLKVDYEGRLNFEHLSAKLFVSEIKKENCEELMFPENECHRKMADIVITAIEKPHHYIWRDSGINSIDFGSRLRTSLTAATAQSWGRFWHPSEHEEREWREITDAIDSAHFGRYLFNYWVLHCNRSRNDKRFVQKMVKLFHSAWSSLEDWVFITGAYIYRHHRRLEDRWMDRPRNGSFLGLGMRATSVLSLDQDGTSVHVSPFLFMLALGFSPFTRGTGTKPVLLPCFSDDDITLPNVNGRISLHIACALRNDAIVTDLLEFHVGKQGSCIPLLEAMDEWKRVSMHYASTDKVVKTLLRYEMSDLSTQPADNGLLTSRLLDSIDKVGRTARYHITGICSDDFLETIFNKYPQKPGRLLDETLLRAVAWNKEKTVASCLENGANIESSTNNSGTPLSCAAGLGNVRMLKFLLDRGAMINNAQGGDGNALMTAIKYQKVEAVRYLVDQGACLDTSLHVAVKISHVEIAQILLNKGMDINTE